MAPDAAADHAVDHSGALPVYVYFHGGGWTSGDKASLTKYCAAGGVVVVNVNYRTAPTSTWAMFLRTPTPHLLGERRDRRLRR